MPQVSRKQLPVHVEQKLINALGWVIANLSKEDLENFLNSLWTNTEKLMLAKRLAIAVLLGEGKTDSEISEALNVTRITVAKLRAEIEVGRDGFKIATKKLAPKKQMEQFKVFLLKLAVKATHHADGRI